MSTFNLTNTATQVDTAIQSVVSADTAPTAASVNMVTSGGVKTYVDNAVGNSTDGFTPTSYGGEHTVTLPNGLIMKFGTATANNASSQTFSFTGIGSSAFPSSCINVTCGGLFAVISSVNASGFTVDRYDTIFNTQTWAHTFYWQAIGY
jgi:hypothetical protein